MGVVTEKKRLEMGQRVMGTKQPDHPLLLRRRHAIKLMGLQTGKLIDQHLVDDKLLPAIGPRGFVTLRTAARFEKFRHQEIGIAKHCGKAELSRHLLGQK